MSYKIVVLKAEVTTAPKGYKVAEIAYKTDDGKTKGMKVLDFVQKDIFATLKDVKAGDVLNADFEKNAKGFWQFAQVVKTGETADMKPSSSNDKPVAAASKAGGNWETSAERAARQVMIVRQSSLSNAINFLTLAKSKVTDNDVSLVIDVARDFEAYVLGAVTQTGEVE